MTAYTYDDLYVINYTDVVKGTITIPKATVITDILDITLLGKSLLNYGEIFDENVLHLLEHFACVQIVPPVGGVITPDLSQISPEKPSANHLLSHPTEGQFWFNKTDLHLYVFTGTGPTPWSPVKLRNDIKANSGIIAHGQMIPLPLGLTSYDQCSFIVTPQYLDGAPNYMACYADGTGKVYMRYRPTNAINMVDGLANYIILGNVEPETHYISRISVTPTLTAAPILSVTPTNTVTPTPTRNPASSITPTISVTPTQTVTITPSLTGTPVITPTPTPQPTPTPTLSSIPYSVFDLLAGYYTFFQSNAPAAYYAGYESPNGFTIPNQVGDIQPRTFNGVTIAAFFEIWATGINNEFAISLLGSVPQTFFSKIQFTDKYGINRIFNSADAQYYNAQSAAPPFTQWIWPAPGADLDFMWTANTHYTVLIYP